MSSPRVRLVLVSLCVAAAAACTKAPTEPPPPRPTLNVTCDTTSTACRTGHSLPHG